MINGMLTGLRIYLEGGHVVAVKAPQSVVEAVVNAVTQPHTHQIFKGTCLGTGISWAVRADKIVAAHSFDWEAAQEALRLQLAAQQPAYAVPSRGMSGPH